MTEFRYRRRRLLAGVVFLVVVVAVSVVRLWPETGPVGLVRDYFEAIRDRDVAEALEVAGIDRPGGEAGRFLVPEALSGGWEVLKVAEEFDSDTLGYAEVEVVLEGPDGKRHEHTVKVLKEDGLRIEEPLARARFDVTPLQYVEVGEVRAPLQGSVEGGVVYRLLPGFYRFYEGASKLVRVRSAENFLPPGEGTKTVMLDVAVTPAGERAVANAYKAFIDQCVRKGDVPLEGCTFGPRDGDWIRGRDVLADDPRQVRWRVRKYPTVAVYPSGRVLAIVDRAPGTVELSGVGRIDFERTGRFSIECDVRAQGVGAVVGMDDKVSIRASRSPGQDTCRDAPMSVR